MDSFHKRWRGKKMKNEIIKPGKPRNKKKDNVDVI